MEIPTHESQLWSGESIARTFVFKIEFEKPGSSPELERQMGTRWKHWQPFEGLYNHWKLHGPVLSPSGSAIDGGLILDTLVHARDHRANVRSPSYRATRVAGTRQHTDNTDHWGGTLDIPIHQPNSCQEVDMAAKGQKPRYGQSLTGFVFSIVARGNRVCDI